MDVKVQMSNGEIYSLELELNQDDTVNSLVSQVSACLASVSTGTFKTSTVALNGAQLKETLDKLGTLVYFVINFTWSNCLPAIVGNR